jgi:ribonuclease VapC
MVIDTSALMAILLAEPEQWEYLSLMQAAESCLVSAAALVETSMAIEMRKGVPLEPRVDLLLREANCVIVAVTEEQANVARNAFRIYGKGRHPARLNFGDCFSYALAKVTGEPLLFKGNDFNQTDVKAARPV